MSISLATGSADFSRYTEKIDQDLATVVSFDDIPHYEPFVFHPALLPKKRLSKEERTTMLIKMAALRVCAGLESRSLRKLALEIGCTHTAIDNAVQRISDRLGMRKQIISDERRARLSQSRRRSIASRAPAVALA